MKQCWGAVCFSRAWSNPLLWAHDADKHKGIALGFDVHESLISPATYISSKKVYELGPLLDMAFHAIQSDDPRNLDVHDIFERLIKDLHTLKFEGWKYEDEVRLFGELKEKISGMYFREL